MKKILSIYHGIIPALLITLPVGSVYAFSLFSTDMCNVLQCSLKEIQFAFSLSIFFLGMGAAFGGTLVEKNIKLSSFISAILFACGLICTGISLYTKQLWLTYVGYGCLCGIAQGLGYLTPVKTLLLWFPKHKGLATAISIISFGLGSSLCTLFHSLFFAYFGILNIFFLLAIIYIIMMLLGCYLIKKPNIENNLDNNYKIINLNYLELFKDKFFICSWLFMFLNISAGLSLIGSSTNIFKDLNISSDMIIILMMLAGVFNGGFRLVFAWISDFLKIRLNIWYIINCISIVSIILALCNYSYIYITILIINACYGGGFSCIASILSDHYGNNKLSRIHGLVLSAWGIAGLVGNNITTYIFGIFNSYFPLVILLLCIYIINILNSIIAKRYFKK